MIAIFFLGNRGEVSACLSKILHEDLGIATITKLSNTLLTNLSDTLAGKTELVANFL